MQHSGTSCFSDGVDDLSGMKYTYMWIAGISDEPVLHVKCKCTSALSNNTPELSVLETPLKMLN
jgi:hypothetical protein